MTPLICLFPLLKCNVYCGGVCSPNSVCVCTFFFIGKTVFSFKS